MYLRAGDTLNGKEGKATATIDRVVEDMFYVKSIETTFKKNKNEVNTIGSRVTQHKAAGWSGEGSMTIYLVTSRFAEICLEYVKTGKDMFFELTVVNDDPASSIGKQTVIYYDVNLNDVPLSILNADNETLEIDIDFTFEGFDILDSFKPISG